MSQDALSEIRAAMLAYRRGEVDLESYQLEFVEQEVSNKLERVKKVKRVIDIAFGDLALGGGFATTAGRLASLSLGLTSNTEELKRSLIKRLEESLGFLTTSRRDLEQALITLFEAWEAYVAEKYAEAGTKARHSRGLVDNSVRSCLIGIAKENIRRIEAKVSMGRRIFAKVKDARKMLDSAKSESASYDTRFASWNAEAKAALESIIEITKSAETEAQYSIDDAKLPFVVNAVLAILAVIGAGWTIFNILRSLHLL